MKTHRAFALIAALFAAGWNQDAGARAPEPASPGVLSAAAAPGKWQAGTNYRLLPEPQPTSVAAGKIEVNEIFWYGCAHCYALDPTLETWKTDKAAYIEFVRVPVIWGPIHRQHAKLFYTLQALHRPDLHSKVFDAIHQQRLPLAARDEVEARAMHFAFFSSQGVTEKDFNAAYDSMSVAANMLHAEELTRKFAVESVPIMIVNGKYSTSVSEAGGPAQLLSLINDLAASEKHR